MSEYQTPCRLHMINGAFDVPYVCGDEDYLCEQCTEINRLRALLEHGPEWRTVQTNDGPDLPKVGEKVQVYCQNGDWYGVMILDEGDDGAGPYWEDTNPLELFAETWPLEEEAISHWRKLTPPTKDSKQ